jgi:hypothetical protein
MTKGNFFREKNIMWLEVFQHPAMFCLKIRPILILAQLTKRFNGLKSH